MDHTVVTLDTSHLEMSLLNDDAEANMSSMLVTLDTSHLERSPLNEDASLNILAMLVTLDTSHLERSPLNDDAEANMPIMSVTLDTSHLERSPLNLSAPGTRLLLASKNNWLMSVTAETSHDPIGPCGPLEQSVDSLRHSTKASWSSDLDFGAHAVVGRYYSDYMVAARVGVRMVIVSIKLRLRTGVLSKRFRGGIDIDI